MSVPGAQPNMELLRPADGNSVDLVAPSLWLPDEGGSGVAAR